MRPEYRREDLGTGVRGKYLGKAPSRGAEPIVLEPDVARAFPDSTAVNDALRLLLKAAERVRRHRVHAARAR